MILELPEYWGLNQNFSTVHGNRLGNPGQGHVIPSRMGLVVFFNEITGVPLKDYKNQKEMVRGRLVWISPREIRVKLSMHS